MEDMHRRTTVLLRPEEDQALRAASRAEGRSQSELIRRGIVPKRTSPDPEARQPKSRRNHAFALHRSNSYYHEIIVDLGYYAPLR